MGTASPSCNTRECGCSSTCPIAPTSPQTLPHRLEFPPAPQPEGKTCLANHNSSDINRYCQRRENVASKLDGKAPSPHQRHFPRGTTEVSGPSAPPLLNCLPRQPPVSCSVLGIPCLGLKGSNISTGLSSAGTSPPGPWPVPSTLPQQVWVEPPSPAGSSALSFLTRLHGSPGNLPT